MKNKKGFTLIELLAVIVILGLLMVIAIPAVTRYIENAKKEAFIKEINSLVDTVRYGINSGDSNYLMDGETYKKISLKDNIELEKGENTIEDGYLIVTKNNSGYNYSVKVTKEKNNYCLKLTDINKLNKNSIINCDDLNIVEYHISKGQYKNQKISFAGSNWYVIKDSTYADDYVTIIKEKVLQGNELIDDLTGKNYSSNDNNNKMTWYTSETCHYTNDYDDGQTKKYTDIKTSGCSGNNTYEKSRIKDFLEKVYIKKIGDNNLMPDENGYKIRLITLDELENNLEWTDLKNIPRYSDPQYPPRWVYKDFNTDGCCYYTMSYEDDSSVSVVHNDSGSIQNYPCGYSYGVRPVINLSKSSIGK